MFLGVSFKEKKKTLKTEAIVIEFFKKAVKASEDEMMDIYDEFLFKLKKENAEEDKQGFLIYFDFVSWVESKLQGKKFIDVLKLKRM